MMAYNYKKKSRMSATKRAYLAGLRKGKAIARKKNRFSRPRKKRWY